MTAHILQSRVNTCLAACACMLLNSAGHHRTEDELIEQWGPPPARGYEHQFVISGLIVLAESRLCRHVHLV